MFKRVFWLMTGAGFGFGVSFWVMRAVRSTVDRYKPERVTHDVSHALRGLSGDVRAAVVDGREAMRDYERDLRVKLETQ